MKGGAKHCVLIIDDTPMQLVELGRILSSRYEVKIAKSGEEGLKLLKEHNIDLILLDLVMPGMSGFEVLACIKESEETAHIPVIFITGSSLAENEEKALSLGAVDYIHKPFVDVVVNLRVGIHLRLIEQMKFIENISLTDGLTGIGNRRNFDQTVKAEWNHARRAKEHFSMLLLDIDKFKLFNDTYGHLSGDLSLKTVAGVIDDSLERESDTVFRWGGEEFAVLLPCTPTKGAVMVAERIRENVAAMPIRHGDQTTSVTISIGVGSIVPPDASFEEAFTEFSVRIDQALYRAKEKGRNRVEQIE